MGRPHSGKTSTDSSPERQHVTLNSNLQERLAARQVKRESKAAERQEKSEALKSEGDILYLSCDYRHAVDRYKQAIRVHGPSIKPALLANLAAAYHNLGRFPEAYEAINEALFADPKSVKARYYRAIARQNLQMYSDAAADLRVILRLCPSDSGYNQDIKNELARVERCCHRGQLIGGQLIGGQLIDMKTMSKAKAKAPAPEDEPELGESLSESSDCEHTGNGEPCKKYNHGTCTEGHECPFSHAPDHQSERDALGRNVCKDYLMNLCKVGRKKCSYLHSNVCLVQRGWWSTAKGISKERKIYQLQQCRRPSYSEAGSEKKKKRREVQEGKKSGGRAGLHMGGPASRTVIATNRKKLLCATSAQSSVEIENRTGDAFSALLGSEEYDNNARRMFGFTRDEAEELLSHGVKPWHEDAWNFLVALHNGYKMSDNLEILKERKKKKHARLDLRRSGSRENAKRKSWKGDDENDEDEGPEM